VRFLSLLLVLSLFNGGVFAEDAQTKQPPIVAAQAIRDNLLPRPRQIEPVSAEFPLSADTSIVVAGPDLTQCKFVGQRLADLIAGEFGVQLKPAEPRSADDWRLSIAPRSADLRLVNTLSAAEKTENAERYRLYVDARGASVSASSYQGLLWAAMTFRQLLIKRGETVMAVGAAIDDWPRYPWRGFMIDAGRVPNSPAQMKRIARICSAFKLNFVVFREGDDELAAVRYQTNKLGRENPFALSIEQIKEFVEYCDRLGIAVVPEIESLGHSAAKGIAYPGLAVGGRKVQIPGIGDQIRMAHLDPADPQTMPLLESIYREWFPIMNGPFVHLGLDEVRLPKEAQAKHLERLLPLVEQVAEKSGKNVTPLVWGDAPPTPEAYRDSVVRVPWSYACWKEVNLSNPYPIHQGFVALCAEGCKEKVIMGGGSTAIHSPYSKDDYEGAFRNLAEWTRLGNDRKNFIGLLVVQWCGNMLDDWLPDFLAGADDGWTPPREMPPFAAQMARVRANLSRLADAAHPAPGEVDRPAWAGIWLKGREWGQAILKTPPAN
jgi:hypothetical protein